MSKINHFLLLTAIALCGGSMHALDVSVTEPGTLNLLISDVGTKTLSVVGSINAADLRYIGSDLSELSSLDMSKAKIDGDSIPECSFIKSNLQNVVLPESIVKIGQGAFAGSTKLTTINIPANATLGSHVFSDCSSLTEIEYKAKAVSDYTFRRCTALTKFKFDNIETIGEGAFYGSGLHAADFIGSATLHSVGKAAFADCKSLTDVAFDGKATNISIGQGAFFGCTALTTLTLPSISNLSDHTLTNAAAISAISLPASLESLGDNAMAGMTALKSIDASSLTSVPAVGDEVWRNVDQGSITVTAHSAARSSFETTAQWQEFTYETSAASTIYVTANETTVKARFVGSDLQIIATGGNIERATLYDTAGITLTSLKANTDSLTINTSEFQTTIYIVTVTLSNGNIATTKLIRK